MTMMAVLARYGHVQPDVYRKMDHAEAAELARRCLDLWKEEKKQDYELATEMTKVIAKSAGAKVF